MSKEEKIIYNIETVKANLAIEGLILDEEDIELLNKYANGEITLEEAIEFVKKSVVRGA